MLQDMPGRRGNIKKTGKIFYFACMKTAAASVYMDERAKERKKQKKP